MIQAFLKKPEKSQINNLTYHLKELEKEQTKPKVSRRKEIIKIKEDIINERAKRKNRKHQCNQELFFWKDKQNVQTPYQAHQEEKREDPFKQNEMKEEK